MYYNVYEFTIEDTDTETFAAEFAVAFSLSSAAKMVEDGLGEDERIKAVRELTTKDSSVWVEEVPE